MEPGVEEVDDVVEASVTTADRVATADRVNGIVFKKTSLSCGLHASEMMPKQYSRCLHKARIQRKCSKAGLL